MVCVVVRVKVATAFVGKPSAPYVSDIFLCSTIYPPIHWSSLPPGSSHTRHICDHVRSEHDIGTPPPCHPLQVVPSTSPQLSNQNLPTLAQTAEDPKTNRRKHSNILKVKETNVGTENQTTKTLNSPSPTRLNAPNPTKGAACDALFASLVCWVAWVIENPPWVVGASTDGMDMPIPRGMTWHRRIDPSFEKACVALGANEKAAFGTRQFLRVAGRFIRNKISEEQRFAKWDLTECANLRHDVKCHMSSVDINVLGIACDGVRLNSRDTL